MIVEQDAWYVYNGVEFQIIKISETLVTIKILGATKERMLSRPLVEGFFAERLEESPFATADKHAATLKVGDSLYFKSFNGESKEAVIDRIDLYPDESRSIRVIDRYGIIHNIYPIDIVTDDWTLRMLHHHKVEWEGEKK